MKQINFAKFKKKNWSEWKPGAKEGGSYVLLVKLKDGTYAKRTIYHDKKKHARILKKVWEDSNAEEYTSW
jgi:hypothetical protein